MKKTAFKDARRNIKRKFVSWLSIVIVTMMAVGVFLGSRFYRVSDSETARDFFNGTSFYDLQIVGNNGFSAEEIESIEALDYVAKAEGTYSVTACIIRPEDEKKLFVPFVRLNDKVSVPKLIEGKLPEKDTEVLMSCELAASKGYKVGDTLKIEESDSINGTEFVISGLAKHPEYSASRNSQFVLCGENIFNKEAFKGYYMDCKVRLNTPDDMDMFTEDYFEYTKETKEKLDAELLDVGLVHDEDVHNRAQEELDNKKSEAEKEITKAEDEIDKKQKEYDDGIKDGNKQLNEGRKKLKDGEKELNDKEAKLKQAEEEFKKYKAKALAEMAEAEKMIEDAKKKLDPEAEEKLQNGIAEVQKKQAEAQAGLVKLAGIESKVTSMGFDLPGKYYDAKGYSKEVYMSAAQSVLDGNNAKSEESKAKEKVSDAVEDKLKEDEVKAIYAVYMGDAPDIVEVSYSKAKSWLVDSISKYGMAAAIMDVGNDAIDEANNLLKQIQVAREMIAEGEAKLAAARDEYALKVREAESKLADARRLLEEGRKKLEEYKAEFAKKETEFNNKKTEGAEKLEDARNQLEDKKKEYEDGIKEAQEEIDNLPKTSYVVLDRKNNAGFLDVYSMYKTMDASTTAFIIMFIIVGTLVCFSTITIIIDEQKDLVGTMKSLGFFNAVIRSKYLFFGIMAIIAGIISGLGLAFVLQKVMAFGVGRLFVFGHSDPIFRLLPTVMISIAEVIVAIVATFLACRSLLRQSAVQLMSGQTNLKRVIKNKSSKKGSKHKETAKNKISKAKATSLYSKLIIRNMYSEIERVIISIVIISGSCAMIGIGFSMKYAFDNMVNIQFTMIQKNDVDISYTIDKDKPEISQKVEETVENSGVDFIRYKSWGTIYKTSKREEYVNIYVFDTDDVSDYYLLEDYFHKGKTLKIPEEGIIIQGKMHENDGIMPGDKIEIRDQNLQRHEVEVKGVFMNRMGRSIMMSKKTYKEMYGEDPKYSAYMVNLNGVDKKKLEKDIIAIDSEARVSVPADNLSNYDSFRLIYRLIVYIMTFLALIMSIFVLSNLTNIFVNRRKQELIVMRVNGFSVKKSKGYLIKETLFMTIVGLLFAVIYGAPLAGLVIGFMDQPDTNLGKSLIPKAWLFAVLIEGLFAAIINYFAFRKVKKFKVTDINS